MKIPKSNFSEWYNTITKEAQLCDLRYGIKGFVVFMPWAVMTMNRMYSMYEFALEGRNHVPAWFPALIPESYFTRESDHVKGFIPEVFWVTEAGGNKTEEKYAMRPTSETAMYTMYALWIHGKTDLPLKLYQRCQVWRHETKATKPFIRSREFHWIEAHNCFATREEAMAQVREDMEMAEEIIHGQFGVPFLFFKRPQWDKFAGAEDTFAADTLMPDGRALQLPSTHMLGQNFSKAFGIKYTDENGKDEHVWQTCYGPCISRIYAAIIATHGDDKGLVLPVRLAPVQVVIVPIVKDETKAKVLEKCEEVKKMIECCFVVKIDNSEKTPGFKFNEWEMKGVPIRIEIGMRDVDSGSVVIVRRDNGQKTSVKLDVLEESLHKIAESLDNDIRAKADKFFSDKLSFAYEMEELGKKLEAGHGFVRIPFCSDELTSESCAGIVKDKCQANVRGSLFGSDGKPEHKKCIACGAPATIYLYAARQY
ncbi:Proline--tRNA ligase [Candidatus Bilamarchaeum dharawalense]|uniref:Proline--tRNA ligase n=1 Tax=Candidatus Bilamarchaeum dharawalense TaxID=2885759 RepID=A0A5E4LS60_9ARCH|nr:Proline--tRNA ligase [Candidatus Bilamarchaeum dharawalense]